MSKYPEQAREISALIESSGLSLEAMAAAAGIHKDSLRKVERGYQRCSALLMQSMRNIADRAIKEVSAKPLPHESGAGYRADMLEFARKVEELERTRPEIVSGVKSIVDGALKGVSSEIAAAARAGGAAAAKIALADPKSSHSREADATSARKRRRGRPAGEM